MHFMQDAPSTPQGNATPPPSRDHWWPLTDRPLLAICIAFIVGVWVGSLGLFGPWAWLGLAIAGVAVTAFPRTERIALAALCMAALGLGALVYVVRAPLGPGLELPSGQHNGVTVRGYVEAERQFPQGPRRLTVDLVEASAAPGQPMVDRAGKVHVTAYTDEPTLVGCAVRCSGTVDQPAEARGLGQFDAARYAARAGVVANMWAGSVAVDSELLRPPGVRLQRAAALARQTIVQNLRDCMPGPNPTRYADLVASMVYGVEVSPVPKEVAESFRRTGTIHLLVVSGAQITLIAGLILWMLRGTRTSWVRRFRHAQVPKGKAAPRGVYARLAERARVAQETPDRTVPRMRWGYALALAAPLVFFTLMVGTGPSVSRALGIAFLYVAAGIFRMDYDPYTAVGVVASVVCLFDPKAIYSIGAQLSFAAALGVVVALRTLPDPRRWWQPLAYRYDWLPGRLDRPPLYARVPPALLAAAVGSWLMVTPLLAFHFSGFPALGSTANLVAVPMCMVVMICGCSAMALSFVWPAAAALPCWMARWMIDGMIGVNHYCEGLPLAYIPYVHFSGLVCMGWYGALLIGACAYRGGWVRLQLSRRQLLAGALVVLLALSLWYAWSGIQPAPLRVAFLDVGHGQCCVVESPSGKVVMVDAGSGHTRDDGLRSARGTILPYLSTRSIGKLDALVITHPDSDHCNAAAAVLEEMPVATIIESFNDTESGTYSHVMDVAEHVGVPVVRATAGGRLDLGAGVWAEVLWPTGAASDAAYSDNDRSIVLMLSHGHVRMLLTGDIGDAAESGLLKLRTPLAADVLQVPHHGSSGSLSRPFLQAVRPQVAVVSCPPGDVHHPHSTTLGKLTGAGVRVLRTDLDGAVTLESNGKRVRAKGHVRSRVTQSLGPSWAPTWSMASRSFSGDSWAMASASGESFGRRASMTRAAISRRTSGASSNRRCRNLRTVPYSSPDIEAAEGRTTWSTSSGSVGCSVAASTTRGSSCSRSFTTTVPAAMSPSLLLCRWAKKVTPPTK